MVGDEDDQGTGEDQPRRWLTLPRDIDAPFHWSRRFTSPEATFAEIHVRLGQLLEEIASGRHKSRLSIDIELIQLFHRRIFGTAFPGDAGRFRQPHESVAYGVLLLDSPTEKPRFTQVQAVPGQEVRQRLEAACAEFLQQVSMTEQQASTLQNASAAQLFVEFLKVHPFVDGNLRVGVALLQAALRRLGQPALRLLPDDVEMAVGLSFALRPGSDATLEPLTSLIRQRLER